MRAINQLFHRLLVDSFHSSYMRLLLLFIIAIPAFVLSQEKKEVEIINADFLKFQEIEGKSYTRLVGNVQLKQDEMLMWCDSSLIDKETNSVDAWGNIHIQQDTINAYSNVLHYDGNTKFATLNGNARISDSNMKLYTAELFYDVRNKTAYYVSGGRVLRDSSVILSKRAYYYNNTSEVFFNGNVSITDPNYNLTSDTLKYNVETKRSTFFGNTEIINKESRILCNNGWFDSERDLASFGRNTRVINPPQTLLADSLYYERGKGFGRAYYHFQWIDTSMDTELFGEYGEYSESRQYIMATRHPLLIYKMEKDSLFLTADTLKSMNKSERDSVRNFYAYRHVRMYMNQMQGVCDSLFYSFEDSTFRFFYKPVLWSDGIQMSGDTIFMVLKNKKADKLTIYRSGFIVSPSGKKYFDQIKGTNIFGYFKDNELSKMDVEGNAESLYFGKDEKEKYIGNNKALSRNIAIYFANKKIDRIVFIAKPEAVFTPTKLLTDEQLYLSDFKWQIDRKPQSREDLTK
ncbi:MAG: hypothetical protein IPN22_05575 [Bacteroidetes bacterium]|nr:hypothetical protein [Bacteroidota bacterium]